MTKSLTIVQQTEQGLEKQKAELASLLGTTMEPEKYIKSAIFAILDNAQLKKCNPLSLVSAIVKAAVSGLDFYPMKGHAYLVPYWSKKLEGYYAQFQPGYRGLMYLLAQSSRVEKIEVRPVYNNEKIDVTYGLQPNLEHKPVQLGEEPGEFIGAYAIVFFRGEVSPQFILMPKKDIDKIRARSKSVNKDGELIGPWKTDYVEMACKTVLRKLCKLVPIIRKDEEEIFERVDSAIQLDNETYVTEEDDEDVPEVPDDETTKKEPEPEDDNVEDADFEVVDDDEDAEAEDRDADIAAAVEAQKEANEKKAEAKAKKAEAARIKRAQKKAEAEKEKEEPEPEEEKKDGGTSGGLEQFNDLF